MEVPFDGIRDAGTLWSPQCDAVKDFLSRNSIPYRWLDVERDEEACALVEGATNGTGRVPVVFFPDGMALVQPEMLELAQKAGLQTQATKAFYDLVIVGAGLPAWQLQWTARQRACGLPWLSVMRRAGRQA